MAADRRLRVALAGDGDAASTLRDVLTATHAFELEELAGRTQSEPLDVAVLVHDGASEPREELARLREHTGAPVVLATTAPSSELVRWALDAGVADVLWLPAPQENVSSWSRRRRRPPASSSADSGEGRVVTVFSPKGGSGKSVVSTNLAVAAATHAGTKTLLDRPRPAVRRRGDHARPRARQHGSRAARHPDRPGRREARRLHRAPLVRRRRPAGSD